MKKPFHTLWTGIATVWHLIKTARCFVDDEATIYRIESFGNAKSFAVLSVRLIIWRRSKRCDQAAAPDFLVSMPLYATKWLRQYLLSRLRQTARHWPSRKNVYVAASLKGRRGFGENYAGGKRMREIFAAGMNVVGPLLLFCSAAEMIGRNQRSLCLSVDRYLWNAFVNQN